MQGRSIEIALVLATSCVTACAAERRSPGDDELPVVANPPAAVACAVGIDASVVIDGARDVAAVDAMLTSLCACAAGNSAPNYVFTVDVGENSRTLVLHRFEGGEEARTCFLDVVERFTPPSRFRTRFELRPSAETIAALSRKPHDEQAALDSFNAAHSHALVEGNEETCEDPTLSKDRPGCSYELDYTVESLTHGAVNSMGSGMQVREAEGRACLVHWARAYRPPRLWRYEWSITPNGAVC